MNYNLKVKTFVKKNKGQSNKEGLTVPTRARIVSGIFCFVQVKTVEHFYSKGFKVRNANFLTSNPFVPGI